MSRFANDANLLKLKTPNRDGNFQKEVLIVLDIENTRVPNNVPAEPVLRAVLDAFQASSRRKLYAFVTALSPASQTAMANSRFMGRVGLEALYRLTKALMAPGGNKSSSTDVKLITEINDFVSRQSSAGKAAQSVLVVITGDDDFTKPIQSALDAGMDVEVLHPPPPSTSQNLLRLLENSSNCWHHDWLEFLDFWLRVPGSSVTLPAQLWMETNGASQPNAGKALPAAGAKRTYDGAGGPGEAGDGPSNPQKRPGPKVDASGSASGGGDVAPQPQLPPKPNPKPCEERLYQQPPPQAQPPPYPPPHPYPPPYPPPQPPPYPPPQPLPQRHAPRDASSQYPPSARPAAPVPGRVPALAPAPVRAPAPPAPAPAPPAAAAAARNGAVRSPAAAAAAGPSSVAGVNAGAAPESQVDLGSSPSARRFSVSANLQLQGMSLVKCYSEPAAALASITKWLEQHQAGGSKWFRKLGDIAAKAGCILSLGRGSKDAGQITVYCPAVRGGEREAKARRTAQRVRDLVRGAITSSLLTGPEPLPGELQGQRVPVQWPPAFLSRLRGSWPSSRLNPSQLRAFLEQWNVEVPSSAGGSGAAGGQGDAGQPDLLRVVNLILLVEAELGLEASTLTADGVARGGRRNRRRNRRNKDAARRSLTATGGSDGRGGPTSGDLGEGVRLLVPVDEEREQPLTLTLEAERRAVCKFLANRCTISELVKMAEERGFILDEETGLEAMECAEAVVEMLPLW